MCGWLSEQLPLSMVIANAERNFSRLKLLKTYLRSTRAQDLNGLAISINCIECRSKSFDEIIGAFQLESLDIPHFIM